MSPAEGQSGPSLPEILISGRHLNSIVNDAWAAVLAQNDPPRLFQHGSEIAELRPGYDGPHKVHHLLHADLRGRLDRLATWLRATESGPKPARPPGDVIEDMLALEKPLPPLRAIIGTPRFSQSGELSVTPGYQPETGYFYETFDEEILCVPACPDATDILRAKQFIRQEWLADFPLADDASTAHVLAIPITAVAREFIDGPTPLFAFDAPAPGTGKGLLCGSLGIILTGSVPAVIAETGNEEELRKRITALLSSGGSLYLLDNLKRRVESGTLAALLTSTTWSDRLLGKNQTVELPNRAIWLATGNNLQLDGEIARRTVRIRLDSGRSRPWERTGFRHPDLVGWLKRHRHELVWSFLVLVQDWVARGRPEAGGPVLGSFESWSQVVGGVLQAAGINGFLDNRAELYSRADEETEEWGAFVEAWYESFGQAPVRSSVLLVLALELIPSALTEPGGWFRDRAMHTRLGQALRAHADQRFGSLFLRSAGKDSHTKAALWRLEYASEDEGVAVPGASSSAGPAEVPQRIAEIPDSPAVPAVLAVSVSEPVRKLPLELEETVATPIQVPQVPQPPQSDSIQPLSSAGPLRDLAVDASEVPHQGPRPARQQRSCACGQVISILNTDGVCGRCKSDAHAGTE